MTSLFSRARLMVVALAAMLVGIHGVASAATLTYVPNDSALYGASGGLDHHNVYTWVITAIDTKIPSGQTVTGASLFFDNIRNWDSSSNRLFLHLLDTALQSLTYRLPGTTASPSGGTQYMYTASDDTSATPTSLQDNFAATANTASLSDPVYNAPTIGSGALGQAVLVANGTRNTPLGTSTGVSALGTTESWITGGLGNSTHSFTTTAEDYTYSFTAAQILDLNSYIAAGGDIALALDPDCHFFLDGLTFVLTTGGGSSTSAVPEPASLTLMGLGLAGMYLRRRKQQAAAKATAQAL